MSMAAAVVVMTVVVSTDKLSTSLRRCVVTSVSVILVMVSEINEEKRVK